MKGKEAIGLGLGKCLVFKPLSLQERVLLITIINLAISFINLLFTHESV